MFETPTNTKLPFCRTPRLRYIALASCAQLPSGNPHLSRLDNQGAPSLILKHSTRVANSDSSP